MIYVDTSALTKLVVPEAHSVSMLAFASNSMVTSDIGAVELRRAVRRHAPEKVVDAEQLLAEISTLAISREVLRSASLLEPSTLRTLDAIHLATALVVRDELEAFVAYDERLLEAARALGIPTASPGV